MPAAQRRGAAPQILQELEYHGRILLAVVQPATIGAVQERHVVVVRTGAAGIVLPELAGILAGIHNVRAKILTKSWPLWRPTLVTPS